MLIHLCRKQHQNNKIQTLRKKKQIEMNSPDFQKRLNNYSSNSVNKDSSRRFNTSFKEGNNSEKTRGISTLQ